MIYPGFSLTEAGSFKNQNYGRFTDDVIQFVRSLILIFHGQLPGGYSWPVWSLHKRSNVFLQNDQFLNEPVSTGGRGLQNPGGGDSKVWAFEFSMP